MTHRLLTIYDRLPNAAQAWVWAACGGGPFAVALMALAVVLG